MNWNEIPVYSTPQHDTTNADRQKKEVQAISAALKSAASYYDQRPWSNFCLGKGDVCRDIASKLDWFGSFASDKQRNFALKLIEWATSEPRSRVRAR